MNRTIKVKILRNLFRAMLAACILAFHSPLIYAADSDDGNYYGSSSGACGASLLINVSDGDLTGTFEGPEGSASFSGEIDDNGHFEVLNSGYTLYGHMESGTMYASVYSENHDSECPSSFDFELTKLSTGSEVTQNTFNSIQELNSRKEVTERIVNEVFIREDPTPTPGTTELSPSMRATTEYQSLNIPFSYSFNDSWKIKGEVPVFYADENFYMGNISSQMTYYSGSIEEQLVLSSLKVDLPTGAKEIGGGGWNVQSGQSRVIDFDKTRMFVSYYYMYTSEVDGFDMGDSLDLAFGMDFDFEEESFLRIAKVYGILTGQMVTEAKYEDFEMNDDRTTMDITLGLVFDKWDMRAGLSIPVMTLSDQIDNSDRMISLDVGFHWGSQ